MIPGAEKGGNPHEPPGPWSPTKGGGCQSNLTQSQPAMTAEEQAELHCLEIRWGRDMEELTKEELCTLDHLLWLEHEERKERSRSEADEELPF